MRTKLGFDATPGANSDELSRAMPCASAFAVRASDVRGATLDAQFVVFSSLEDAEPEARLPSATGAQATVTPIESGDYRSELRKLDRASRFVSHRIYLDLPMAIPR